MYYCTPLNFHGFENFLSFLNFHSYMLCMSNFLVASGCGQRYLFVDVMLTGPSSTLSTNRRLQATTCTFGTIM